MEYICHPSRDGAYSCIFTTVYIVWYSTRHHHHQPHLRTSRGPSSNFRTDLFFYSASYIDKTDRFFSLRLCSVLRPFRVRILLKNPCLLLRTSRLVRAIVGLGPQRICTPAKAGWAVMAVFGARSRISGLIAPEVLLGTGAIWESALLFAERKTVLRVVVGRIEGRSWGNDENALRLNVSRNFWDSL